MEAGDTKYTGPRAPGGGSGRGAGAAGGGRASASNRTEAEGYGAVRALDPKTGDKKWEFKMVDYTESGVLTTASDLLFSGGREGHFFALDARTGELLWRDQSRRHDRQRSDHVRGRREAVRGGVRRQHALRVRAAIAARVPSTKFGTPWP